MNRQVAMQGQLQVIPITSRREKRTTFKSWADTLRAREEMTAFSKRKRMLRVLLVPCTRTVQAAVVVPGNKTCLFRRV